MATLPVVPPTERRDLDRLAGRQSATCEKTSMRLTATPVQRFVIRLFQFSVNPLPAATSRFANA